MTIEEALSRVVKERDYRGNPTYPVGSVASTLAKEVVRLRKEATEAEEGKR